LSASASCTDVIVGPAVNLSWTDSSSSVSGYEILRSSNGSGYSQVATVSSGAASYTDTSVQGLGVTYWYEVVAFGPGGRATSAATSATTPLTCVSL
jgi:hypothetical protein